MCIRYRRVYDGITNCFYFQFLGRVEYAICAGQIKSRPLIQGCITHKVELM